VSIGVIGGHSLTIVVLWKDPPVREHVMTIPSVPKVRFQPKWKELLVCTMDGKTFSVELTMGVLTVYFPEKAKWEATAPAWARGQWNRVQGDLSAWCLQEKIPLVIDEKAWVEFE
jgi:hypothetical protein